jgi:hypothetical protein
MSFRMTARASEKCHKGKVFAPGYETQVACSFVTHSACPCNDAGEQRKQTNRTCREKDVLIEHVKTGLLTYFLLLLSRRTFFALFLMNFCKLLEQVALFRKVMSKLAHSCKNLQL